MGGGRVVCQGRRKQSSYTYVRNRRAADIFLLRTLSLSLSLSSLEACEVIQNTVVARHDLILPSIHEHSYVREDDTQIQLAS